MNELPDFFVALTGWRKFNTRDSGRVLVSANHPIPWLSADPGEAVCVAEDANRSVYDPSTDRIIEQNERHPKSVSTPALKCSCGYYVYKRRMDAQLHHQGDVLARVEVWGRIVEHAHGYRAGRIKIVELFVSPDDSQTDIPAATRAAFEPPWNPIIPLLIVFGVPLVGLLVAILAGK